MQVIGRSAGRSATAAAAYRSGEEIKDERTGKSHDYTGKSDIYDSEILLPKGAPERLGDRVTLWNEVERVEKRKDAQLSREVMIALPAELTHEQKQALTREYVRGEFTGQGMIADIGYHDFDSHNPHAHIMLTMRSVDEEGFGKKRRDWNRRQVLERQRKAWEEYANRALEQAGFTERIDHRSLKEQGIEREPQIHLGAKVMEMEARGVRTRVGDESRRIGEVNRDIERRAAQREKVQIEIEAKQIQNEPHALSEYSYPHKLESEAKQATSSRFDKELFIEPNKQQSDQYSAPDADLDLMRRFGELSDMRREETAPTNSPEASELSKKIDAMMSELSATLEGVAETTDRLLAELDESQGLAEQNKRQEQLEEGRSSAPSNEKKQKSVQRQEQLKQRQRKQVKKRDQGMEL